MSYTYPPQKRLNDAINRFINTFLSVGKVVLQSRRLPKPPPYSGKPAIVIGAARSLEHFIDQYGLEELSAFELFVSNNFAQQAKFEAYRPQNYVILDSNFWEKSPGQLPELLERSRESMRVLAKKTTWPLRLYLPRKAMQSPFLIELFGNHSSIKVLPFNDIVYYGYEALGFWLWRKRIAMPPMSFSGNTATFLAILAGAPEVYMAGIENSYIRMLMVDEHNKLWVERPYANTEGSHTYADKERMPHDLSLFLWHIQRSNDNFGVLSGFAHSRGQRLYNATPTSIIDTVERRSLPIRSTTSV